MFSQKMLNLPRSVACPLRESRVLGAFRKSGLRSAARLLIIANQYTCMAVDLVTGNKI